MIFFTTSTGKIRAKIAVAFILLAMAGLYQPTQLNAQEVNFGQGKHDSTAQIDITADNFSYDEAALRAHFSGNVRLEQDKAILVGDDVVIHYENTGALKEVIATGNVVITRGQQSAQAERAFYRAQTNIVELSGEEVIVIDAQNIISGKNFVIDINQGTGIMQGRATIILRP